MEQDSPNSHRSTPNLREIKKDELYTIQTLLFLLEGVPKSIILLEYGLGKYLKKAEKIQKEINSQL